MAVAFTFPGQGSQMVGMGRDLAAAFPEARLLFEEVDDAIHRRLSSIIWDGPEEKLTPTVNAQPALMAVSMAFIRVMESCGLSLGSKVAYVAGHSLGEYSALCAAKAFSLADTARLLCIRSQAMQEAVPLNQGAMAAIIGLDLPIVIDICEEASRIGVCEIANDNGGEQLVISGSKLAVEHAMDSSLDKGAKRALLLPVSAPFHSSLMVSAVEPVRQALNAVQKRNPVIPLVANVCAKSISDIGRISELLVEQVTGRVHWREIVKWFAVNNVSEIYEIGAGRILTSLVKRIDRSFTAIAVNKVSDIDIALRAILG